MSPLIRIIDPLVLQTILGNLALLFLTTTNIDPDAARQAATRELLAYKIRSEPELRLAAEIISFSYQALQALSQAANPELSLTRVLRLRASAVSLSRQANRSQARLDRYHREQAEPQATEAQTPAPAPEPAIEQPDLTQQEADYLACATKALAAATKNLSPRVWSREAKQRRMAQTIAENSRKAALAHAAKQSAPVA